MPPALRRLWTYEARVRVAHLPLTLQFPAVNEAAARDRILMEIGPCADIRALKIIEGPTSRRARSRLQTPRH